MANAVIEIPNLPEIAGLTAKLVRDSDDVVVETGKPLTIMNSTHQRYTHTLGGTGRHVVVVMLGATKIGDWGVDLLNVDGTYKASDYLDVVDAVDDIDIAPVLVINSTAPELQSLDANGKLTIHRGDYTTFDLTLGSLVGRTGKKLVFTLKPRKDDEDDDLLSYLQVTEVDGAVLVNGSSDGVVASDASMVVLNENTGQTRFVFKGEITDLLPIGSNFWYDVQMFDSAGQPRTKTEDRCEVSRDVTRRSE